MISKCQQKFCPDCSIFCEFPSVSATVHAFFKSNISTVSFTQELLLLLVSWMCKLQLAPQFQLINCPVWTRFSCCKRLQVNRHLKQEDREVQLLISVAE